MPDPEREDSHGFSRVEDVKSDARQPSLETKGFDQWPSLVVGLTIREK